MISNKKALLTTLKNIAKKKRLQAFLFEDLAHSLEYNYKNSDFKTWKILTNEILDKYNQMENNGHE